MRLIMLVLALMVFGYVNKSDGAPINATSTKHVVVKRGPRGYRGPKGPEGIPGLPGIQGPAGPVNVDSLHQYDNSLVLHPGEHGSVFAQCRTSYPPESAISGGFNTSLAASTDFPTDVNVIGSRLTVWGNIVTGINKGSVDGVITSYVSCVQVGKAAEG